MSDTSWHGSRSIWKQIKPMPTATAKQYFVIPLSIQKEGDCYLVGSSDLGEFYQIPEQGVRILSMLKSGDTAATISSKLEAEYDEKVNVDNFIDVLASIGFVHPEEDKQIALSQLQSVTRDGRRTFNVDPKIANAIFSMPVQLICLMIFLYSAVIVVKHPELRLNSDAFYTDRYRTALLLVLMSLTLVQVALHECGHMLAAARHGIRSKYGIGNRLWSIVAESDLTGIFALPKLQRYFPMLAGLLVDILCVSILTIVLQVLLMNGAGAFTVQVTQALILEIAIGITWQFNIFVKTDVYFVICNYFGYSDLDRDARVYLRDLVHKATFGLFGKQSATATFRQVNVLRAFSLIWIFGRVLSLLVLFGVVLPTMAQYIESAIHLLRGPSASFWIACDTIIYVSITMTMLGTGMYMWLKQR